MQSYDNANKFMTITMTMQIYKKVQSCDNENVKL